MKKTTQQLVLEMVGGEPYEYYPVTSHIVVAPGVCGGRPTFKYTRIDVRHALDLLSAGHTVEGVAESYQIPAVAVREALTLAAQAFGRQSKKMSQTISQPAAISA